MKKLLTLLLFFGLVKARSQEYFPINSGVKTYKDKSIAFKNARIFITPKRIINNGTLLIKEGKVVNVGKNIAIPKGTHVIDLKNKSIYPSFIDVYSEFGIKKPKQSFNFRENPQYDATRKDYYWNDHIRPDINAFDEFVFDKKEASKLLKQGFGVVNTHVDDGIMQGSGVLVTLNTKSTKAHRILSKRSGNYLSFSKSKSKQVYPTSKMGAMALIRQAYLDAQWYEEGHIQTTDLALEALNNNRNLTQIFKAGDYLNSLRADKIGDEFGIQYVILGGGDEYERIKDIKKSNATFIIPLNYRKPYDVTDIELTKKISLRDLRKWNQEPSNPGVLQKNNIQFATTLYKLKSLDDFYLNIRKAINFGLDKTVALESLTTIPSQILKNPYIGNLNIGSHANFIICSGDLFDKKTTLYENWIQGTKHIINPMNSIDIIGEYTLTIDDKEYKMHISQKEGKYQASIKRENQKIKANFSFKNNWIQLTINDKNSFSRITAKVSNTSSKLEGSGIDHNGNQINWQAIKQKKEKTKKSTENKKAPEVFPSSYPNVGFGNYTIPKQETILIKNTTIWTSENNKVLKNSDLLISDGKISKLGKNLSSTKAKIIDGTNKYLTAGIIDEHSHIAASAINEAGHNSSAEVTIEDVINPDDINIYRNIAGGVTSIQILHGSANPIGGRSAIIKLKWGESADKLLYKNSPKFIKFALGENVKQSNWGDHNTSRFPQTRMGVEQVYIDYFQRAKEYDNAKKSGKPYRKDIELEALAEILNKQRFISCHSYVQSEINMLMKVAEKFNFNINTFTHILEGYKIADKMKEHGVGGSTFSDWWAYKYEVNDAIPYNAAIMHNQGITVAINSDDPEMSRRLNQEAAKTMKYGNLSEQEAWNTITINPAKLLHLDKRTGSIKVGKDADVVLWSDNPLSIFAKVEKTIIEGAIFFDIQKDRLKREELKEERTKLINLMLQEKIKGSPTQNPSKKIKKLFHCDTQ